MIPSVRRSCSLFHSFVTMRSGEQEPFIKALQKLWPDLTRLDLGDQLEALGDDVGHLLGRLQLARSFEPKGGA